MDILEGRGDAEGAATQEDLHDPVIERERSGFYRKLLKMHLREVLEHLRVEEMERTSLTRADLRSMSARFDDVLDFITGTSRRDRMLVWLDQTISDFAAKLTLRGTGPPRGLRLSRADRHAMLRDRGRESAIVGDTFPFAVGRGWGLSLFGRLEDHDDEFRFAAETMLRLPGCDGPLDHRAIVAYLSALMSPRRGRPRRGAAKRPTKWELFHELAVSVKLWDRRQSVEVLARTVRKARLQLRSSANPRK